MNTLFIGQHHIQLNSINSTNDFAEELLQGPMALEGTLVTASEQFAGVGQRGNTWYSEPGKNINSSFILTPRFLPVQLQFQLNKMASLAVMDFVKLKVNATVSVKWPNDIYINDKKAAGILIKNFLRQDKIIHSVTGIGINVNQTIFPEGLGNATSLKAVTGFDFDISQCINELCECLEARYIQLKSGSDKTNRDYLQNLYQLEEFKNYVIGDTTVVAKITGVSEFGKLILENTGKEILECDLKEIKFIH